MNIYATTTGIAVCRDSLPRGCRDAANARQIFFPLRGKFTATFAASLSRPLPHLLPRLLPHLLPRLLPQDCSKYLFIFCRDVFRTVIAPFAATFAATIAGHFSANTIELFTASIYALFDAVIAANDSCSFFIPIAAQLPPVFPHILPPRGCRAICRTVAATFPHNYRDQTDQSSFKLISGQSEV
jgi:hypothetical protein